MHAEGSLGLFKAGKAFDRAIDKRKSKGNVCVQNAGTVADEGWAGSKNVPYMRNRLIILR